LSKLYSLFVLVMCCELDSGTSKSLYAM